MPTRPPSRSASLLPVIALLALGTIALQAVENYFVYVSSDIAGPGNITCYSFDPAAATLNSSPVASNGGTAPGYLAWSPARNYLYSINSSVTGGGAGVTAFAINATTGALTKINDLPTGGTGPTHLCVHPSGKWVFVAHFSTPGEVTALSVVAGGGLGAVVSTVLAGHNAHMALTNAAGTRLYVPCREERYVAVYIIDPADGHLTAHPTQPHLDVPVGAGPRHMAFTNDERFAYVINEFASTMSAFSFARDTDRFTYLGTVSTLPGAVAGNTCAHVEVSNDNLTLFGSNRGHDSIVSYDIASGTGLLSNPRYEFRPDPDGAGGPLTSGIQHPRDFTIDPTGQALLVAGRDADRVTSFRIAPTTGALTFVDDVVVTNSPTFVGVMPKPGIAITLTSLAVTPQTATLAAGGTRDFDARGRDQFGALMYATPTVAWSVSGPGTIDGNGLFTAGAAGTTTITASDGVRSATATVTTTAPAGGASAGSAGGGGGGCGVGGGTATFGLVLLLVGLIRLRTSRRG